MSLLNAENLKKNQRLCVRLRWNWHSLVPGTTRLVAVPGAEVWFRKDSLFCCSVCDASFQLWRKSFSTNKVIYHGFLFNNYTCMFLMLLLWNKPIYFFVPPRLQGSLQVWRDPVWSSLRRFTLLSLSETVSDGSSESHAPPAAPVIWQRAQRMQNNWNSIYVSLWHWRRVRSTFNPRGAGEETGTRTDKRDVWPFVSLCPSLVSNVAPCEHRAKEAATLQQKPRRQTQTQSERFLPVFLSFTHRPVLKKKTQPVIPVSTATLQQH